MKMGTFLAIAAALALSAASHPVVLYRYHVPAGHHVTARHHDTGSHSQYVQTFRKELLTH
jgi:hypothetical protein